MNHTEAQLNEMTIAQLTDVYNVALGKSVKKAKGAKAKVVALILAAAPPPPVEVKTRTRKQPSARSVLRLLFPSVGERKDIVGVLFEVKETARVKEDTVWVAITDLKNPKWCGKGGVVTIERDGEFLKRVA